MTDDPTPLPVDPLRMAVLGKTAALPGYVGYWLARHRKYEGLNERALLTLLGVRLDNLAALALCAVPDDDQFDADVRTIAARCGADPVALATLLRREMERKKAKADAARKS